MLSIPTQAALLEFLLLLFPSYNHLYRRLFSHQPKNCFTMGSVSTTDNPIEGLGNQALLDKIDKLRELNVGSIVSLPQLVVVGDQSSGKSSVLESLTGFSFPRAAGLCTRYATQITCRREPQRSVSITIIPRPDANEVLKKRLREFHRCLDKMNAQDLAGIFEDANSAMGIRSSAEPIDDPVDGSLTFSEDILKIEINGPDQPGLTVIDVPGIFRAPTPGVTTESDIELVTSMVKRYITDSRTILLAVIPCNVDVATQEILQLAKDVDPNGCRTMGVLTKPDLVLERATQQAILDLIQGRRQKLKLGYYVVKNRGADDESSSLQKRNEEEKAFFRQEPWASVSSSGRLGSSALKTSLRDLLMEISKKGFPTVKKGLLALPVFMCTLAADTCHGRGNQEAGRVPQESGGHGRFEKRRKVTKSLPGKARNPF